ncbi:MAG: hypothetical protein K6E40_02520 [Desulfovibrio sp.]|nr:hypothetical protein [Desulfovibrio sp.]
MKSRALLLSCLLVLCTLLAACGPSNAVRLLAVAPDKAVLPQPSAPTVTVVKFSDKRPDPSNIGLRRDKSYFTTTDDAKEWAGRAAATALGTQGFQVAYAATTAEAIKGKPDYMLTGSLRDITVTEDSMTSFTTTVTVKYALANSQKTLLTETLSSSQTHTGLPSSGAVEDCLRQTLSEIVKSMAIKVADRTGH